MVSSTVTLDQKHVAKAKALAEASNITVDDLIARALDHYEQYTKFVRAEVAAADKDVEEGRVFSLEETRRRLQERRQKRRADKARK